MRRLLMLPLIAAALLLAACDGPAEFTQPLGPPGAAPYDARLVGAWYSLGPGEGDEETGIAVLVIRPGAEVGTLDGALGLISLQPGPEGGAGFASFNRSAHATVIDGQTYLSTRLIDGAMASKLPGHALEDQSAEMFAPHSEPGYWITRATIRPDGVLLLDVLTENAPTAAGYQGREVDCGDDCDFMVYDLTPEQMAELIRSTKPEDLFRISIAFARFGRPPPPQPE